MTFFIIVQDDVLVKFNILISILFLINVATKISHY